MATKTEKGKKTRLPTVDETGEYIDDDVVATLVMVDPLGYTMFLDDLVDKLNQSIVRYKESKKKFATNSYDGQILYWTHQVATLKWLKSLVIKANG